MSTWEAIQAAATTAGVVANIASGQGPNVGDALQIAQEQQQRNRIQQIEQATVANNQPYYGGM